MALEEDGLYSERLLSTPGSTPKKDPATSPIMPQMVNISLPPINKPDTVRLKDASPSSPPNVPSEGNGVIEAALERDIKRVAKIVEPPKSPKHNANETCLEA